MTEWRSSWCAGSDSNPCVAGTEQIFKSRRPSTIASMHEFNSYHIHSVFCLHSYYVGQGLVYISYVGQGLVYISYVGQGLVYIPYVGQSLVYIPYVGQGLVPEQTDEGQTNPLGWRRLHSGGREPVLPSVPRCLFILLIFRGLWPAASSTTVAATAGVGRYSRIIGHQFCAIC